MAIAGVLLTVALGAALWHWFSGEARSTISELTAASIAALDRGSRYNSSGHYWRYFLDEDGGQLLVEQAVLLALEAVKAEATPGDRGIAPKSGAAAETLQEFRSFKCGKQGGNRS